MMNARTGEFATPSGTGGRANRKVPKVTAKHRAKARNTLNAALEAKGWKGVKQSDKPLSKKDMEKAKTCAKKFERGEYTFEEERKAAAENEHKAEVMLGAFAAGKHLRDNRHKDDGAMTFGERIKFCRKEKNMCKEEFAMFLQTTKKFLKSVERGKELPSIIQASDWACVLGIHRVEFVKLVIEEGIEQAGFPGVLVL